MLTECLVFLGLEVGLQNMRMAERCPRLARYSKRAQHGFSLLELQLAVAVMAILAAIAWPIYQQHVLRVRRHAAVMALYQLALRVESQAQSSGRYLQAPVFDLMPVSKRAPGWQQFYQISFEVQQAGEHFVLRAAPQPATAQSRDSCGSLSLDDRGQRSISGGGNLDTCWR